MQNFDIGYTKEELFDNWPFFVTLQAWIAWKKIPIDEIVEDFLSSLLGHKMGGVMRKTNAFFNYPFDEVKCKTDEGQQLVHEFKYFIKKASDNAVQYVYYCFKNRPERSRDFILLISNGNIPLKISSEEWVDLTNIYGCIKPLGDSRETNPS